MNLFSLPTIERLFLSNQKVRAMMLDKIQKHFSVNVNSLRLHCWQPTHGFTFITLAVVQDISKFSPIGLFISSTNLILFILEA